MFSSGFGLAEIASTFGQHFGIASEKASEDVESVVSEFMGFGSQICVEADEFDELAGGKNAVDVLPDGPSERGDCGTFLFGETRIKVSVSVAGAGTSLFSRFRHRLVEGVGCEDALIISATNKGWNLIFRGCLLEEGVTATKMRSRLIDLLLNFEHSNTGVLAYCHAAAVSNGSHSLLMPGDSGVGKSTLTGYLVANGYAYLGDDVIAIGDSADEILPLPTCLSIKEGSWILLAPFYPTLLHTPQISIFGRTLRYIPPEGNYKTMKAALAPSAIVFPTYKAGTSVHVNSLQPVETIIRLVKANAALAAPATAEKLEKFLRFVEQTPAYELTYSELPSALKAIEDLLAAQPQE